jgi:hypothetical protein
MSEVAHAVLKFLCDAAMSSAVVESDMTVAAFRACALWELNAGLTRGDEMVHSREALGGCATVQVAAATVWAVVPTAQCD